MSSEAKSRLTRYSLRMMLGIVTALAVYFGVLVNWKTQRATGIEWIEEQAQFWDDLPVDQGAKFGGSPPFPLGFIGAVGLENVSVVIAEKKLVAKKQAELEKLFPEADVFVCCPGTGYKGKHAHLVKLEP